MVIDIEFNYKKPERLIDLVHRELGEAPSERASTITRILWRHGPTLEQVKDALKVLVATGRAEVLENGRNELSDDPAYVGIFPDEGTWLEMCNGR